MLRVYPIRGTNRVARDCESRHWVRFNAVLDSDKTIPTSELSRGLDEMNIAFAVTIILDRMVRRGRSAKL
jgi:hypothetical protein